jgi:hypothetical protein
MNPSTLTDIFLPSRKDLMYWKQDHVTPYSFNLYSSSKCHVRSKAAVRSKNIASTERDLSRRAAVEQAGQ